jgi:hypothetical protein
MREITRTIITSVIFAVRIEKQNGKIVEEPCTPLVLFNDIVNDKRALKLMKKAHGKQANIIIDRVEHRKQLYGIPFNTFMEHARLIELPEQSASSE